MQLVAPFSAIVAVIQDASQSKLNVSSDFICTELRLWGCCRNYCHSISSSCSIRNKKVLSFVGVSALTQVKRENCIASTLELQLVARFDSAAARCFS